MTAEEYKEWADDPRVGKCPYCESPGWIIGDDAWCVHYLGSKDDLEPGIPESGALDEVQQLNNLVEIAEAIFNELTTEDIQGLSELTDVARDTLRILEEDGNVFWCRLIPVEKLYTDVSSSLYDTSYTSYFTADTAEAISTIRKAVSDTLSQIAAHPELAKFV